MPLANGYFATCLLDSLLVTFHRCYAHVTSLVTKAFLTALSPPTKTTGKRNGDQPEDEKDDDDEEDIQQVLDNVLMDDLDDDDDDSPSRKSKLLCTLLLKICGLMVKVRKSPQAKV